MQHDLLDSILEPGGACVQHQYQCNNCGWNYTFEEMGGIGWFECTGNYAGLLKLDIDDSKVALDELGAHLTRYYRDIYALSSRRFEELVSDIYKQLGYFVILTPQTRDDGVDVYIYTRGSDDFAIVECKRYSKDRKVTVSAVDRLIGTAIIKGARQATLVTTSYFTGPARRHACSPNLTKAGINLDLADAGKLLKMLGLYNTLLPPLDVELDERWKVIFSSDCNSHYYRKKRT